MAWGGGIAVGCVLQSKWPKPSTSYGSVAGVVGYSGCAGLLACHGAAIDERPFGIACISGAGSNVRTGRL